MSTAHQSSSSNATSQTTQSAGMFVQPLYCVVCGQATTNRCSKCAKVEHHLAFCSPEHQRLVWPTHRRLCGRDLDSGIHSPWLSRKEAEEAVAHFDHEVPGWSNDVESIAQWLRKLLGRPVTQEILQDFTEGNKHPLDFSAAQDALGAIREVEFGRKTAGLELDDAFRDCDVFTIVNHVWSTVQPLAPSKELWFGGWIHRLAILLHLTQ
ncbi:hypothetical protein OF846_001935 [Rhodotorula toruloides]|nr:hypothetical protein OF846_001935 [Rhodotorula toruloides]